MNEEVCCYCGNLANTGDRIPPKSFFKLEESEGYPRNSEGQIDW